MSIFSYMKVFCPICCSEMNGMNAYGRESHCCGKSCHDEWEWRRSLAVMGERYRPYEKSAIARKEGGEK